MPILRPMLRICASLTYWAWPWASVSTSTSPSMVMRPLSMVSRWFRQRKKVLLPEPDGPMTATTSPRANSRLIPRSTGVLAKRLQMFSARIMTSGSMAGTAGMGGVWDISGVKAGMAALQVLENPGQYQRHAQIKTGGHDKGREREVALHHAPRHAQQVV